MTTHVDVHRRHHPRKKHHRSRAHHPQSTATKPRPTPTPTVTKPTVTKPAVTKPVATKPVTTKPKPKPTPTPVKTTPTPTPVTTTPAPTTTTPAPTTTPTSTSTAQIYPTIADAVAAARHTAVAPLGWNPIDHLLSRFTFGPTVALRTQLQAQGWDGWFDGQVSAASSHAGYSGNSTVAAAVPLLSLSPYDARQYLKSQGNEYGWDVMDQLTRATIGLQAWSSAQVYETLVDFFSNHLNVANHNGDMWVTRHTHDRDVVRKYALDSFTNMLLASAKNPAMLQYLNLAQSTKAAINENYGRELLELHTVGRHYSESDVKNAAKLLTGRTLDQYMHYVYDDYIHGTGAVQVLDFTHANASAADGEAAGDALLRYLAAHPLTAQNLARKLCVRFVSDNPSAELVNAVAKAYTDNDTAILPMVQTVLRSTEFWESRGQKIRRPAENVMATIRILDVQPKTVVDATNTLHWVTYEMGQTPLDWAAPNGYPDVAVAWRSAGTMLNIWQMHLGLTGGWWGGLSQIDVKSLYSGAATSGQAIDMLTTQLTGTEWTATAKAALQSLLGESAATPIAKSAIQWHAVPLIGLVLDSPQHAMR